LGSGNIDQQLGPRNGANLLKGECSDFEGLFDHVYRVSFPAGQRKKHALSDHYLLIDFDVLAFKKLRSASMVVREARFLSWAALFLRSHGVRLIVAINPYLHGLNAYVLSQLTGSPYGIMITRDWDFDYESLGKLAFPTVFPSRRVEKFIERFVLRHADLVVADREHYWRYALKNGANPERTFHSRVVVDDAYYIEPCQRPNVRELLGLSGGKLLLTIGRLQPDKLPEDALRCLALVRAQGLEARLAFAGDGEMQPQLAALAEELGLRSYVHFLGPQPLHVLPALMSSADVIVGANMGYTLVEAALSGRPIVTYDYEWHAEVVHHGETGALVPYRDLSAMADWVGRLLRDDELAKQLGHSARVFALQHHERASVMRDYRRIYGTVLDRSCPK